MIVTSSGDSGDCVYLSGILKVLPNGPHTLLIEPKDGFTASGKSHESAVNLLRFMGPLLASQPYIKEVRMAEAADQPDWRSGGFREARLHDTTRTLMVAHLRHLAMVRRMTPSIPPLAPWLKVDPSPETRGMVVINRTERYRNKFFKWHEIVDHYKGRLVFVGLQHEWKQFCESFGYVSFRETKTLLDVARLIAGSDLFIGNQSCAYACAEGLKHNSIQETSTDIPDCIYPRPNAQYVPDGKCLLPNVSGSGEFEIRRAQFEPNYNVQTMMQPRRGWICEGIQGPTFKALKRLFAVKRGVSEDEAHKRIIRELYEADPAYFGASPTAHQENETITAVLAIQQAGHMDRRPVFKDK